MTQAAKLAVPLLLLAAAAAGAFYLSQQSHAVDLPQPVAPAPAAAPEAPRDQQPVAPAAAAPVERPTQDPVRTAANLAAGNAYADAPQGVRGRVLLPNGAPAAEVPVFLMENSMNDPIKVFLQNKTGARTPPAASGTTAADGTFALGARQHGKAYDLRVVSPDHPEINFQNIKVREEDWFDTGELRLELGAIVQGRVVEEGSNAAVPEAMVFLTASNQAHAMVATPGRERGVSTTTDGNGFFRFQNAPKQGLINLAVEASGYAGTQLLNQNVKPDEVSEFTLQVVRGLPIAGVVVDQDGKPLGGVAVTAAGLSAKTPQTATATSSPEGAFAFSSLREGPYQLTAASTQFAELKTPPILAGDTEVKLVLTQKAYVKLRVLAANRAPVKSYSLSLKRFFPNNPLGIGNVPEFPDRRINPSDYPAEFQGEWAVIRGVPAGEYVFQLQDAAHAKSLSPAFTVVEGGPAPEVEAVLTLGAVVQGTVVDDRGTPVANATVSTDMNGGFAADSGFFEIFRSFIPEKHSKAQTKTDAQGRFRITKLAFADYMLRVSHPEFCEGTALDLKLESEGQVVDAGVITLNRGAIVEGIATVGGEPAGQVKVTVTVPQGEGQNPPAAAAPGQAPRMLFSATAISDGEGRFRLLKRVPPGTYKINASRQSGDNNPFLVLLDMKESEQVLQVMPGQDRIERNFNLPKR